MISKQEARGIIRKAVQRVPEGEEPNSHYWKWVPDVDGAKKGA